MISTPFISNGKIHRIRRQLFKREELFRLISDNATDTIAVVDVEGHRIYNSMSYQTVLGYSLEELKESSSLEQIHPDDRERVKRAAEESRVTGAGLTLEYRIRHKNGTWRVLESTASVIRNAKGAPEKFVIVNRDITERKSAQEALRLADADFKSVVEDAPYGIYRANGNGQLFRVNPALQKMLGYESSIELLKANLQLDVFKFPLEFRTLTDLFNRAEDFKEAEAEWKRKDGTPITVRCSGRRKEVRVGLRVPLKLSGQDATGKDFSLPSAAENVSKGGFLCACAVVLSIGSIVDVFMLGTEQEHVGKARVVRAEWAGTQYPRYGFAFTEMIGNWALQ